MYKHKKLKHLESLPFSIYDLIEFMQNCPILWDRDHEHYNNRIKRDEAWHNAARHVYNNFDGCSKFEQGKIKYILSKRWKNTRDSFHRHVRLQSTPQIKRARPYIYHRELSFLLKSNNNSDNLFSPSDGTSIQLKSDDTLNVYLDEEPKPIVEIADSIISQRKHRRYFFDLENEFVNCEASTIADDLEELMPEHTKVEVLSQMSNNNDSASEYSEQSSTDVLTSDKQVDNTITIKEQNLIDMNCIESDPDQGFFDSIKPILRLMSIDEKLDFQIEVLTYLKRYR
ncbi:uncharacterized protein LOC119681894, partial [Teleopsis dalmanni]|uniref:uncharacterized protein LOC119681894 n=1 Tax=Teleopsis dalmanni TaxID=139649 RepID=UPI0018CE0FB1